MDNPVRGVTESVNILTSDTDTIASFVGGLFGAYYGPKALASQWLDHVQDRGYFAKVAKELGDVVLGKNGNQESAPFDRTSALLRVMAWEIGLHEMFWDA